MRAPRRPVRRAPVTARLGLLVAPLVAVLQAPAAAHDEGPLRNDVFLPVSRQADEALARGDEALAAASGARPDDRSRLAALEAWRAALTATGIGDAVTPPASSPWSERGTEGVEVAVLRRLAALAPDARAAWTGRFAELADQELRAAGRDVARLGGVERRNPVTPAAVRAALRAADVELERGDPHASLAWCARATRHAELLVGAPAGADATVDRLVAAIEARRTVARDLAARDRDDDGRWRDATSIRAVGRVALVEQPSRLSPFGSRGGSSGRDDLPGPRPGLRPGLAVLDDGRFAIQTQGRVVLLPPQARRIDAVFEPSALLPRGPARIDPPVARFGEDRDWPLLPAAVPDGLVLVHGRGRAGTSDPNALLRVRPPSPSSDPADDAGVGPGSQPVSLPVLDWAVVGHLRVGPDGSVSADARLDGFEEAEMQPGPLVVGSRVLVQARQFEGDIRAWLLCFDVSTGECLWTRLLAQGTGLFPREFRESGALLRSAAAAAPLVDVGGGRVFAGTNLGAGLLVDVVDGRVVYAWRNRRRSAGEPGWATDGAPVVTSDESGPAVLWAPFDSDHLYRLRGTPAGPEGPSLGPPSPIGEAVALLGGDLDEVLVLSRAGARRTVAAWRARDGARLDSPYLGREEAFAGSGAVSRSRAWVSTDRGLYLLDRERELLVLDFEPFPGGLPPLGGSAFARGSLVLVVGERAVWTFFAE